MRSGGRPSLKAIVPSLTTTCIPHCWRSANTPKEGGDPPTHFATGFQPDTRMVSSYYFRQCSGPHVTPHPVFPGALQRLEAMSKSQADV